MGPHKWEKASLHHGFFGCCRLFFCLVLLSALFRPVWCTENDTPRPSSSSKIELERLAEISKRLASLNETLNGELKDSRKNSEELALSLENSKSELSALRSELEVSRSISTELARSAENSAKESRELKAALKKADSSLRSLETSFEAYRMEAENRIVRLERSNGRSRGLAAVASILAVSGWAAFLAVMAL